MIVLRNIGKSYRSVPVLRDVSFEAAPGELLTVVGPSGSGKTVLLRLLLRSDRPSRGSISIDGVDLASLPLPLLQLYRSRLGFVPQVPMLIPEYTIVENLALPLEIRGLSDRSIQEEIGSALQTAGLAAYATKTPRTVPGNVLRLCNFVRGFLGSPSILLLDEPFAGMSPEDLRMALRCIRSAQKRGATILLSTQDAAIGAELRARELFLQGGMMIEHPYGEKRPQSAPHHVLRNTAPSEGATQAAQAPRKIHVTGLTSDFGE